MVSQRLTSSELCLFVDLNFSLLETAQQAAYSQQLTPTARPAIMESVRFQQMPCRSLDEPFYLTLALYLMRLMVQKRHDACTWDAIEWEMGKVMEDFMDFNSRLCFILGLPIYPKLCTIAFTVNNVIHEHQPERKMQRFMIEYGRLGDAFPLSYTEWQEICSEFFPLAVGLSLQGHFL